MKQLVSIICMLLLFAGSKAQNVGIGTSTPSNKLSVAGNADIRDSLGVGTSTPFARLDVRGDALINGLTIGRGRGNDGSNTACGYLALISNNTGVENTAIGRNTLSNNIAGNWNTSVGFQALQINNQDANTAVGHRALTSNIDGGYNTAMGFSAMEQNLGGYNNVGIGTYALLLNTTGTGNTAIGFGALQSNTTGFHNNAFGDLANVASGNLENATAIGYRSYVASSHSLVLGSVIGENGADFGTMVGIGTIAPVATLDVVGSFKYTDGSQAPGKVLTSDNNGRASWETPGSNVAFKANTNAAQAIPVAANTTLNFAAVEFDDSNNYNPATGIFTAPSAGLYHFDVNLTFDGGATGSQSYGYLLVNGSPKAGNQCLISAGLLFPLSFSTNVKLAAGDEVKVSVYSFGANNIVYAGSPITNFSGYKIR